jgi:hypothetical protein
MIPGNKTGPWIFTPAGFYELALVHNAYKINLRGESMRKWRSKLKGTMASELEEKLRVATLRWVAAFTWNGWQP